MRNITKDMVASRRQRRCVARVESLHLALIERRVELRAAAESCVPCLAYRHIGSVLAQLGVLNELQLCWCFICSACCRMEGTCSQAGIHVLISQRLGYRLLEYVVIYC